MTSNRANRDAAIRALRQSAVIANSAVGSMARAAAKSNPDRMLRCWTAQQIVKGCVEAVKGKSK